MDEIVPLRSTPSIYSIPRLKCRFCHNAIEMRGVSYNDLVALEYLNKDCSKCILHQDIKSSIVLLDADFKAMLETLDLLI